LFQLLPFAVRPDAFRRDSAGRDGRPRAAGTPRHRKVSKSDFKSFPEQIKCD
jgi:hypothetical protein